MGYRGVKSLGPVSLVVLGSFSPRGRSGVAVWKMDRKVCGQWHGDRVYDVLDFDGTAIESCVLVTMPATDLRREIHNGGSNP